MRSAEDRYRALPDARCALANQPTVAAENASVAHGSAEPLPSSYLQRYGLAVVSTAVALGASLLLQHFGFHVPETLLLFAVAISAWYGGTGPAVMAVILSVIAFYWYFVEPVRTIYIYQSEIPFVIIFIAFAALLCWFATVRRRTEAELHESNRNVRALSNCNQVLLRATDEQGLLDEICRIVCEEAGYRMAFVAYAEHDDAKTVRPVAWTGAEREHLTSFGLYWADTEGGRSPTGTAIRTGETCCIQDCATDPRVAPWRESLLQRGFRSAIALPLKGEHGDTFGSLTICSAQPNAFTAAETALLEELAADLAFGIVTLRSHAARQRTEEALRHSEMYLAEAERIGQTGSWGWSPANGIQYWSQECYRIMGFDPAEGMPSLARFLERVHPEDLPRLRERLQRVAREKTNYEDEYRIVHPSGGVRDLHIVGHPFLDSTGNVLEFVGTTTDVTERKRAEGALRQSEAYLAEGQRLAHTGSWALDMASEKYVYVSEECLRIYGFDPQGPLPSREAVFRRVHPEDLERVKARFEKSLHEKIDITEELRIILPDGAVKHIQVVRHPVLNDAGEVVQLVGTSIDITEHKKAQEALRESEMHFRSFWDHAADAFCVFDEQHKIIDANREACASSGYTREELIGMVPHDFDPDVDAAMLQRIDDQIAAGEVCTFETRNRRKDGTVFPVEVRVRPYQSGKRRFHLASSRNISQRKRAEDALRRTAAYLGETQRLTHTGTFVADNTTEPLYWSEEMFRIFGFDPKDRLPTRDQAEQRVHPEDLDKVLEGVAESNPRQTGCRGRIQNRVA
jgi:PAS domain S-box-containing protein